MTNHTGNLPHARALEVHELVHLASVTSTMDEAHARASHGAAAGTLIVADEQTSGRGRSGNVWESTTGSGVWFTLIERPADPSAVDVLSIRLGLALARALEPFATGRVQVKWPNDLYVDGGKLAGILVEARWREGAIDWVAIGIGINLTVPTHNHTAAALVAGTTRNEVLQSVIPAVRAVARARGLLTLNERDEWNQRDLAVHRNVSAPVAGVVRGLEQNGALCIEDASGIKHELRAGSLVFA